jgi:hypothetical protein
MTFRHLAILALTTVITGCSGGTAKTSSSTTTPPPVTPPPSGAARTATTLYLSQANETVTNRVVTSVASSVLSFPLTGGPVSQTAAITSGNTTDIYGLLATDSTGNIIVGVSTLPGLTGKILVFAAGSTGAATPIRTIAGNNTQLTFSVPNFLAVDASNNIYVYSANTIREYAATANGNVAPIRTLTNVGYPANTTQGEAAGLAVDPSGNVIAGVTVGGSGGNNDIIQIFSPSVSGPAIPTQVLNEPAVTPGIDDIESIAGLGTDASGSIYVASQQFESAANGQIYKYVIGPSGYSAPEGVAGSSLFSFNGGLYDLAVDPVGDVYTIESTPNLPEILIFGSNRESINEAPVIETSSAFSNVGSIAVY